MMVAASRKMDDSNKTTRVRESIRVEALHIVVSSKKREGIETAVATEERNPYKCDLHSLMMIFWCLLVLCCC